MRARKEIYDPKKPGVFHCYSRCVRRAFLCGTDQHTGNNYDHRKRWIEGLLEWAASSHVIDVVSFGVMDNHFHVVLRNRPDLVKKLSPMSVAYRWLMIHPERKNADGSSCEPSFDEIREITRDKARVKELRQRLGNISWLMGFVKEKVARRANAEDGVTGTFFEKRYEMQRLLSPEAVLACSLYVDLNPILAGVVKSPEQAQHTSAYLRIQAMLARRSEIVSPCKLPDAWLSPISPKNLTESERLAAHHKRASDDPIFAMLPEQYLKLLDFAGRRRRRWKSGKIPDELAPIMERLKITELREVVYGFSSLFRLVVGPPDDVQDLARQVGKKWFHGISNCRRFFAPA